MRPSGEPLPDPPTTLWEVVTRHAATSPDAVALHFEGHETRYAALRAQAEALAGQLERWGACPESRIGYLGKNTDQYFVLLFAVARIGAVLVPMNWRLAPEEIAFIVADSEMQLLLADDAFLAVARDLCGRDPSPRVIPIAAAMEDARGEAPVVAAAPPNPGDVALQVYTSGTTGRPKGAMLTHANMLALRAPGYRAGLDWFPKAGAAVGVVLPIAHIAGTAYAIFGFYAGARVVIMREFDAGALAALIERERINHLLLAPSAMQLLLEHPAAVGGDFSSLHYITYGASPIPEELLRQALRRFGCGFVQMYGMTEAAGGVVALQPADHVSSVGERLRSAGRAMPGAEVAIVDADWTPLPPGTIGEIAIRSPSVMAGYWRREADTAEILRADGWMRTGDIGRMDADGYVYVLDRAKDMIISGGENIYPAEVENAIFGHPAVAEVAVVGAPSALWGEDVVAVVVARGGAHPTLDSVRAWAEGKIARFKLPKRLVLVDALPRNAGNKVLRREIRALLTTDCAAPQQ